VPGSPLRTPQEPLASASGEDRRQVQPTLSGERGGGSVYPPRSCARLHAPSRKRAWGVQGGVHAFARLHAQKDSRQPTVAKLARRLKPGRSNASRRVRSAKSTDFERDLEDNLRKPLPEDLEMLPAPHKSQAYKACTRAGEIGGIHDTLPQETAIRTPRRGRGYIPPKMSARVHALYAYKGVEDDGAQRPWKIATVATVRTGLHRSNRRYRRKI
jgi:hypothetical protein